MKAIHDNAFPLDDDKKHLEIGCWFACASCGTRTNEDFECICWTKHNWDGTILEDSNWKDNESLIPSYLNPDAVIQDTAQLCSDITHRDLEVWNLWETEYIIWWQIKKTKSVERRADENRTTENRLNDDGILWGGEIFSRISHWSFWSSRL